MRCTLSESNGEEIEQGEALETPANSGRWVYTATENTSANTTVRIGVTVFDQPGGSNSTEFEKTL